MSHMLGYIMTSFLNQNSLFIIKIIDFRKHVSVCVCIVCSMQCIGCENYDYRIMGQSIYGKTYFCASGAKNSTVSYT